MARSRCWRACLLAGLLFGAVPGYADGTWRVHAVGALEFQALGVITVDATIPNHAYDRWVPAMGTIAWTQPGGRSERIIVMCARAGDVPLPVGRAWVATFGGRNASGQAFNARVWGSMPPYVFVDPYIELETAHSHCGPWDNNLRVQFSDPVVLFTTT